jgi:glycogen operon protein
VTARRKNAAAKRGPERGGAATLVFHPSSPQPLGVEVREDGVHFALFSRHASRVWLCLYDGVDADPLVEKALEPRKFRFGDVWSVFVEGAREGMLYTYRLDGPNQPTKGHIYNKARHLLDPRARCIVGSVDEGNARCKVMPQADEPAVGRPDKPRRALADVIIYEVHVKGLTAHPSSEGQPGGTYAAVKEKIPYLRDLGVTAVEFLPVHHCGERVITQRKNPKTGKLLDNYWGYQSIGFFAPDGFYASDGGAGGQVEEFRDLVDALHEADLEVYIDVVYNHTSEYGPDHPATSFRGIDNAIYYLLEESGGYKDVTGCGNTLRTGHPVVSDLVVDSLRYWVQEMGVDGFRFDLACALNRDSDGHLHQRAPLIERIAEDPVLRDAKLIAEPWDIGGGYQVGQFDGRRWSEWNGRYRDDVRRFWRGERGLKGDFANRITGSPDLYQANGWPPSKSINYITCHDGFTLRDLVSYNKKHNHANGENNRDGDSHNLSWNCGAEGVTDDPVVLALRARMQKNFLTTLLLSLGTPMLLGGDEFGRSQGGNNNGYCQDNEISWFDWSVLEDNRDLFRYCKSLIQFRKANPVFRRQTFFTGKPVVKGGKPDLEWFNAGAEHQSWDAGDASLACRIDGTANEGTTLYFMFNPADEALTFALPKNEWRMVFNTAKPPPRDVQEGDDADLLLPDQRLLLGQKSLAVLRQVDEGAGS